MRKTSTAWVFVSHTNRDLNKVRQVRDAIEQAGAQPILFFLKCLSDHDEIDDLIKREIEARRFFLLCDSANAKKSKWVQDEIAHVKSLKGRKIEVIDLDSDWRKQVTGVANIVRRATIFLSYSHSDDSIVAPVRDALSALDFATWDDSKDLGAGERFADSIESAIGDAARFGYFLHFISRSSLRSRWVSHETERALELDMESRYIPIALDPIESISDDLPAHIRDRQVIDYSHRDPDRMLPILLRLLGINDSEQGSDGKPDTVAS